MSSTNFRSIFIFICKLRVVGTFLIVPCLAVESCLSFGLLSDLLVNDSSSGGNPQGNSFHKSLILSPTDSTFFWDETLVEFGAGCLLP